jgi:hypothetical protein
MIDTVNQFYTFDGLRASLADPGKTPKLQNNRYFAVLDQKYVQIRSRKIGKTGRKKIHLPWF